MCITPNHQQFRSIESVRRSHLNDAFETLCYAMNKAENGTKPVSMIKLPDGREAQVFVTIETNPDKFV